MAESAHSSSTAESSSTATRVLLRDGHYLLFSARISPLTDLGRKQLRNGGFFMGVTRPPLEYLASCSKVALESFELSRLNEASNYRKEVQQILQGWIDTEVDARLARWILESKQAQARDGLQAAMAQPVPLKQLDLSFLPSNGAQESAGEGGEAVEAAAALENTRKPSGCKLRRAAQPVLPCADGRTPEEPQKSFGMKGAKLLEKRVGGGSLSGSAAVLLRAEAAVRARRGRRSSRTPIFCAARVCGGVPGPSSELGG